MKPGFSWSSLFHHFCLILVICLSVIKRKFPFLFVMWSTMQMNSRKNASVPIPAPILLRVRELAELHSQVPPNLGSNNLGGVGGRSMHETQSGYL